MRNETLLIGMNDPLYTIYQNVSVFSIIDRFKSVSELCYSSDWHTFNACLSGFINNWRWKSGDIGIHISIEEGREFDLWQNYACFTAKLTGIYVNEWMMPIRLSLPSNTKPYEICRWKNMLGFDVADIPPHLEGRFVCQEKINSDFELVWKGRITVFDRNRFRGKQKKTTFISLTQELRECIVDCLNSYASSHENLYKIIMLEPKKIRKKPYVNLPSSSAESGYLKII